MVPSSMELSIFFLLTLFYRLEKPGYEPSYMAGHEERIGIVMTCSPEIDMTRKRDSNFLFARELVSRRNIGTCVKMPYNGDGNDLFFPYVRGEERLRF